MITFNLTFTGTPDSDDKRAALKIINKWNRDNPTLTPKATSPGAALKASLLEVGIEDFNVVWNRELALAKRDEALNDYISSEGKEAIISSIIDRRIAGESEADILTDVAST